MSITFDVNCAKAGLWIEIYFLETISGLNCNRPKSDISSHRGTEMSSFHRVDQRRPRPGLPTETEGRLPLAQSVAVIAGLSALAWVVLIAIVMGLCGLL